jgi:hypothetical protein
LIPIIYLRWIAYALLIGSIIPAVLSIPKFVKSRRAKYYGIRREALQQALRRLLVMGIIQAVAILLLVVSPLLQREILATPEATAPPTGTPIATTPVPAATPPPAETPTPPPTRRPSPTSTPTVPTVPPSKGPTPEGPTPPLSPVPAGPEASIRFTALAMERNESGLPVNPGFEFPPGDHAIYLFFTYEGMQNGVERTFAWYKDGEFFERCSQTALWEWGDRGRTSYYCEPSVGWEPGDYEIHVLVEEQLQFLVEFTITEP